MATLKRGDNGEWKVSYGEGEDRASVDAILAQAQNDPTFAQALESGRSFRITGANGGNPAITRAGEGGGTVWRAGNWGTQGFGTGDGLVTRGGQQYNRIGSFGGDQLAGKQFQGRPFTDYLLEDPELGTLIRSDALAEAGKYNPRDIGDYLPGVLMGLAGGLPALQGAPSLFQSLGQGLGLLEGGLPAGMTGAEIAGLREGAPAMFESIMNPPGAESSVMGWEQTIPGTTTEGALDFPVHPDNLDEFFLPESRTQFPAPVENRTIPGRIPGTTIFPEGTPIPGMAKTGAASAAGTWVAKQIKDATGKDIDPGLIDLLGKGAGVGLGVYSANQQADRSQALNDQIVGMAERDRADRMPFLNQSSNWLTNPADFWSGPAAQEIARQTGRVIGGARGENLFDNPTGQSLVMQSLAPIWLNAVTQTANLGLRNTAPLSELGNMGLQNLKAQGAPGAVLGSGISDIFNPAGSLALGSQNDILRQLLMRQSGGGTTALP